MGCSLESYRIRIGTFGNSFKGKINTKVGSIKRKREKKGQSFVVLLYLCWCALNLVCAPTLHQSKFAKTASDQCDSGGHPGGRSPSSPSHPPRCDRGGHPEGRTAASSSHPPRCDKGGHPGGRTVASVSRIEQK